MIIFTFVCVLYTSLIFCNHFPVGIRQALRGIRQTQHRRWGRVVVMMCFETSHLPRHQLTPWDGDDDDDGGGGGGGGGGGDVL